ncbi:UNVERIFIED_CONTAM: hypothetical protein HDU68_011358 [Siphonaria sp. JEL0065]|nr:hypothetical protein HDU68_011358 [Siphonaria sp. JEL0065]
MEKKAIDPPPYQAETIAWPNELFFCRSKSNPKVIELFASKSATDPIATIDSFSETPASFLLYRDVFQCYVGTSPGSTVTDLRHPLTPFVSSFALPKVNPQPSNGIGERLLYAKTLPNMDPADIEFRYNILEPSNNVVRGQYAVIFGSIPWVQFESNQTSFKWMPSASNKKPFFQRFAIGSNSSASGMFEKHDLAFKTGKNNWISVGYSEVSRDLFFGRLAQDVPGNLLSLRPGAFAHVSFDVNKITWPNYDSSQLAEVVGTLWSVWMGDVLNKEGKLKEILDERKAQRTRILKQMYRSF